MVTEFLKNTNKTSYMHIYATDKRLQVGKLTNKGTGTLTIDTRHTPNTEQFLLVHLLLLQDSS